MTDTKTYEGLLCLHSWGEASHVLFLSSLNGPLSKELGWMSRKNVTIRYWITDEKCSKEEAVEAHVLRVMGIADVRLRSHYSEYTGYLWTDEDLKIGGHNLLLELKSVVGKWLILEVEVL
jgi:hypothetical protein